MKETLILKAGDSKAFATEGLSELRISGDGRFQMTTESGAFNLNALSLIVTGAEIIDFTVKNITEETHTYYIFGS